MTQEKYFLILSSFMTYHQVYNKSNTTGATSLPEFTRVFWLVFGGVRVARSLVFCVVFCRSLFFLLSCFVCLLQCLSFDLRIDLVSSNSSYFHVSTTYLILLTYLPKKNPFDKLKNKKWYVSLENGTITIVTAIIKRYTLHSLVIWHGYMWERNPNTRRPATCVSPLNANVKANSSRSTPFDTAVSGNNPVGMK